MLEKFEFSVCPLAEHRGGEGFHDLFDGDGWAGQLVFRGTVSQPQADGKVSTAGNLPHKAESAHTDGLKIDIPGGHFEDLKVSSRHAGLVKTAHRPED